MVHHILYRPPISARRSIQAPNDLGVHMNAVSQRTICCLLIAIANALFLSQASADETLPPNLGVYGKLSSYCGTKEIGRNIQTIPEIGCFYISVGHVAVGTVASHRVELSVDHTGNEIFKVDGALVVETHDTASGTQLPYVGVGGVAGYRFCEGPTDRNTFCPVSITVFSRNSDKTILFMVSECLPPDYHACVTTKENWDYERSRRN